jgi:hypothetical protein
MLYVLKKEQIEHARLRALALAIISKDKGKEVFDDYMKVAFPWLETQKMRDRGDHVRILLDEVKKGGLSIRPLWQETKMRSRLRTVVVNRDPKPENTAASNASKNELYSKLGRIVPV